MRIGQLAHTANVPVDTIRYYERIGLLPRPRRSASGYREYVDKDVDRLKFIRNSKALGFTLEETGELLDVISDRSGDRAPVCELAKSRLREIDAQLEALKSVRESLHRVVGGCSGQGPVGACPVTEAVLAHDHLAGVETQPGGGK